MLPDRSGMMQAGSQAQSKEVNLQILHRVLSAVRHTIKRLRSETEILGVFKAKEYLHTAYFTGEFQLASSMHIKVKVRESWHRASLDGVPSTQSASPAAGTAAAVIGSCGA